jgi:hypothetical protein
MGDSDMTRTVLALILMFAAEWAFADVLLIEQVRQADRMDVPVNGQSKDDVQAQFGSPNERSGPVGDPPIYQWKYDSWSVYFEYELVLFTVLHRGEVIENDEA